MKELLIDFLKNLGIVFGLILALALVIASVIVPLMWIASTFGESRYVSVYLAGYAVVWIAVLATAICSFDDLL